MHPCKPDAGVSIIYRLGSYRVPNCLSVAFKAGVTCVHQCGLNRKSVEKLLSVFKAEMHNAKQHIS